MSFSLAPLAADDDLYPALVRQAESLVEGESDRVANAANISSLVYYSVPELNWVGFYFYDGRELVVGPFQGKPACVRIALGRGVCGTAAQSRRTQLVSDVREFAGHIACDPDSRSEIVIPLVHADRLVGVFDVDSPVPGRFGAADRAGIEAVAAVFLDSLRPTR